jgi:hypothetical protein
MFGYAGKNEADVRELLSGLKRACAFVSSTIKNDSAKVNGLAITGPAALGELLTLAP